MGFVDIVGIATGYVQQDFNLSDSVAQLLPTMVFIWFALFSIPTGIFQDRYGKKRTVAISVVLTGVGLIIPFLFYSYITVLIGFSILGIANTIMQVSANPLLADISGQGNKAANLSFSQFVKATAALLSPIIISFLVAEFGEWRLVFPIYAALTVIVGLWLYRLNIPESRSDKAPATFGSVIRLFSNKMVLILVAGIFLIVGFDVGVNSNIAIFLRNRFGMEMATAGYGISVYFGSLMVGRFLGGVFLRFLSEKMFLFISIAITFLGLFGIIFSGSVMVAWISIFAAGLGFSNLFPLIFSIALDRMPDHANEVSGLIILAVSGGAVVPPIMGLVNEQFGDAAPFWVLAICMVYVSYASIYLSNKPVGGSANA